MTVSSGGTEPRSIVSLRFVSRQVPALPHGSAVGGGVGKLGCELRTESGATATTGSRTIASSTSVIRQGMTWSGDRRKNVTQDRRSTEPRRSTNQSGPETRPARLRARKAQTGFRTQVSFSKTWENSLQVGRGNAQMGERMTTRTNADEDGHEMGRQGGRASGQLRRRGGRRPSTQELGD